MKLHLIDTFASRHHALVTLDSFVDAGLSRSTFYRAVRAHDLVLVYPGVARLAGSVDSSLQRCHAAVLAAGPGAMASHRSAAWLWGVPRPTGDPFDVILPGRGRRSSAQLHGVEIHRPRDQGDLRPSHRHDIPCTNILRTLCDLGAVDEPGVNPAVGHVLTNSLASAGALDRAVCSHSRQGRHGIVAFRAALRDWTIDGKLRDSELEKRMNRLRRRYGLPPMEFHAVIIGKEVDFHVTGTPIVVECDGFSIHGRRESFEKDRRRDAELAAAGYIVLRITWRALVDRPKWVVSVINGAVVRWERALSRPA